MGEITEVLARDHERLDAHLAACRADPIPRADYEAFRKGLLRHIGIEERILFPLLRAHRGVTALEQQLHRDHAALSALLVPPPAPEEIATIAAILERHNPLEELDGGLYALVEELSDDPAALLERVRGYPEVPLAPNSENLTIRAAIERLVPAAMQDRVELPPRPESP